LAVGDNIQGVLILMEGKTAGIAEEIDSWMRHIWLSVVRKEHDNGRILEESNLHSTVYFHLRKLMESSKSKKANPFLYSEMPFSTTMGGEGKRK
jgi:hypothetical protein